MKEQHLFEILCNFINVFAVTFEQLLLSSSVYTYFTYDGRFALCALEMVMRAVPAHLVRV